MFFKTKLWLTNLKLKFEICQVDTIGTALLFPSRNQLFKVTFHIKVRIVAFSAQTQSLVSVSGIIALEFKEVRLHKVNRHLILLRKVPVRAI